MWRTTSLAHRMPVAGRQGARPARGPPAHSAAFAAVGRAQGLEIGRGPGHFAAGTHCTALQKQYIGCFCEFWTWCLLAVLASGVARGICAGKPVYAVWLPCLEFVGGRGHLFGAPGPLQRIVGWRLSTAVVVGTLLDTPRYWRRRLQSVSVRCTASVHACWAWTWSPHQWVFCVCARAHHARLAPTVWSAHSLMIRMIDNQRALPAPDSNFAPLPLSSAPLLASRTVAMLYDWN